MSAPVWICDFDGRLRFVNAQARALLGVGDVDCIGQPCHCVVRGTDASGRAQCGPACRNLNRARRGLPNEPGTLWVAGPSPAAPSQRVLIKTISVAVRDGNSSGHRLIHIALTTPGNKDQTAFLTRVAARTPTGHPQPPPECDRLSSRERQILDLLAEDKNLKTVAAELRMTYSTARTHVQHILAKLGVHSTLEAIARHLIERE